MCERKVLVISSSTDGAPIDAWCSCKGNRFNDLCRAIMADGGSWWRTPFLSELDVLCELFIVENVAPRIPYKALVLLM